jgi:uncharacterized protein (DUF736 family)
MLPPMDEDDMGQLRAEEEQILAMPGFAALVKLKRLNRIAKIFHGNAEALLGHLRRMDDLGQMLATTTDQQALQEFGAETERHLHNYVAAAQSRVDLLRRFKREDMPEGLREEYQQRIDDEFKDAPLHKFIIDLRILMLHVRLPVSSTRETWERDGPWTFRVMLDSADLLERWDKWSPEARQYIEASGESIDLRRTVGTYAGQVTAFDRWLAEGISTQHQEDIESFQRAAREIQVRLHDLDNGPDRQ